MDLRTRPSVRNVQPRVDSEPGWELSSPDRFLRAVVAFANTSGGTILIGVEDGTRHVLGVPEPRSNEKRVTNLIADGVSPLLVPDIELLRHLDRLVLAVRVYPSPSRPHYIGQSLEAGAYVRIGSFRAYGADDSRPHV